MKKKAQVFSFILFPISSIQTQMKEQTFPGKNQNGGEAGGPTGGQVFRGPKCTHKRPPQGDISDQIIADLEDVPQQVTGPLGLCWWGAGNGFCEQTSQAHVNKNSYITKDVPGCNK